MPPRPKKKGKRASRKAAKKAAKKASKASGKMPDKTPGKSAKKPKPKTPKRRKTGGGAKAGAGGMAALIAVLATGAGAQYVHAHGGAKAPAFQCDASLWDHLYNPERFDGSNRTCTLAVGTVERSEKDPTGDRDYHIRLRLDPGQEWMLTPSNYEHQDGDLVLEVICAHPGKDAHEPSRLSCQGYTSHVWIPERGDRIAAVGAYVVDKAHYNTCEGISPKAQHCWGELHPVTSIRRID
jgi:hypothetical protein